MPAYVEVLMKQCHERWGGGRWCAHISDTTEVHANLPGGRVTISAAEVDSAPEACVFSGGVSVGSQERRIEGPYILGQLIRLLKAELYVLVEDNMRPETKSENT
jgi:hypothetical protein